MHFILYTGLIDTILFVTQTGSTRLCTRYTYNNNLQNNQN
jgi:hypothetical protein